jgi:hypothetical protein
MWRFFQPWRRKVGVSLLGMACVMMGLWIRGLVIQDSIWFGFTIQDSTFSAQAGCVVTHGNVLDTLSSSEKDGIVWSRWNCHGGGNLAWSPGWKTHSTQNNNFFDPFDALGNPLKPDLLDYRWGAFGIEVGKYHVWDAKPDTYSFWRISHFTIAIPLTLLSAWLLLTPVLHGAKTRRNPSHRISWASSGLLRIGRPSVEECAVSGDMRTTAMDYVIPIDIARPNSARGEKQLYSGEAGLVETTEEWCSK